LQRRSNSQREFLETKSEAIQRIFDDYHKLVEFQEECWYDKDIDELYDDMVLAHLDEEVYMPKDKAPLISLKGHDYFPKPKVAKFRDQKNKKNPNRVGSMPNLMDEDAIQEKIKAVPKLSTLNMVTETIGRVPANLSVKKKKRLNSDIRNSKFDKSMPTDTVVHTDIISDQNPEASQAQTSRNDNRHSSVVIPKTFKTVGKAMFSTSLKVDNRNTFALPQISNQKCLTSKEHLKNMPRIVRKILSKKMDFDPSVIKSIEDSEKQRSRILINI